MKHRVVQGGLGANFLIKGFLRPEEEQQQSSGSPRVCEAEAAVLGQGCWMCPGFPPWGPRVAGPAQPSHGKKGRRGAHCLALGPSAARLCCLRFPHQFWVGLSDLFPGARLERSGHYPLLAQVAQWPGQAGLGRLLAPFPGRCTSGQAASLLCSFSSHLRDGHDGSTPSVCLLCGLNVVMCVGL